MSEKFGMFLISAVALFFIAAIAWSMTSGEHLAKIQKLEREKVVLEGQLLNAFEQLWEARKKCEP
jgi:hypothetical protein